MTTTTYPRRRRRNRPIPIFRRKKQSLISFQKDNKAKVIFYSSPLCPGKTEILVKCLISTATKKIFGWGSDFNQAFENATSKFYHYGRLH